MPRRIPLILFLLTMPIPVVAQIADPFPDIPVGDLAVRVELVARVPGARWMDVIPNGQGGKYGVDQRGRLYEIGDNGSQQFTYQDQWQPNTDRHGRSLEKLNTADDGNW